MGVFNLKANIEVYYTVEANSLEEAKQIVEEEIKEKELNESFLEVSEE